jgi:hypothetical protein
MLTKQVIISNVQNLLVEELLKHQHYTFTEVLFNLYTLKLLGTYLLNIGVSKQIVFLILLIL